MRADTTASTAQVIAQYEDGLKEEMVMPRLRRLPPVPYGWYYIALHSVPHRRLVSIRADLSSELNLLRTTLRKRGAHVHAGYLGERELHLVLQAGEGPVSRITSSFQHEYARLVNKTHGVCGSLFRPHHHVLLFDHQRWLVPLVHYMHWMRRMDGHCDGTPNLWWSSDAAYREGTKLDWLTTNVALRMLAPGVYRRESQVEAYRDMNNRPPDPRHVWLFKRGLPEEPRLLGDARFVESMEHLAGLRSSNRAAGVRESAGAIPAAVMKIVEQFNALCAEGLPARKAMAWKKTVTYDKVCSRSRKRPLPMMRALSVSYLIEHHIATLAQASRFFGCSPRSVSARRRRYYGELFRDSLGGGTDKRLGPGRGDSPARTGDEIPQKKQVRENCEKLVSPCVRS